MELGLLWLLSVSPLSAGSQSRLNAASQKCVEFSRGDLEHKALCKKTQSPENISVIMLLNVSSPKYGPGVCSASQFCFLLVISVTLLNKHYLYNILKSLKR